MVVELQIGTSGHSRVKVFMNRSDCVWAIGLLEETSFQGTVLLKLGVLGASLMVQGSECH